MSKFGIKVKIKANGLGKIQRSLEKTIDKRFERADKEIYESLVQMMTRASSKVSSSYPEIAAKMYATRHDKFKYELGNEIKYSAYVEFGTGPYASAFLPTTTKEWEAIAIKYKTNRPGNTKEVRYFYNSINFVWKKMMNRLNKIFKNA